MRKKFFYTPNRRRLGRPTQQQYWRAFLRHQGYGAHGFFTFGWSYRLVKAMVGSLQQGMQHGVQPTPHEACHTYWIEQTRAWL